MAVQPVKFIALTEELEQIALDFQSEARAILRKNGNNITGRLSDSIKVQPAQSTPTNIVIPVTMLKYGDYVDDGAERGAGEQPPVRDIVQWIQQKRISVPKQFKNVEQFAYVIASSIGKRGQRFRRAYPFIFPALTYAVEKNLQPVANAAALDITFSVQQSINKSASLKK
jgi:hypothetical protein